MTISDSSTPAAAATGNTRARFEQWAQNPTCQANTISAVHNVRMADVAIREGYEPTFGQSPFALARGQTFERNLLWDDAERLITELIRHGVLPKGATGLADFRLAMNGGPLSGMEVAVEATRDLVLGLASGSVANPPAVAASATIRIPRGVMLPEAILMLDALAIQTDGDRPTLIVGEVKTYPDRGGHTSCASLAVARAQAGLYVHALEVLLQELGVTDQIAISTTGFLVLSKPGSNFPSVRAQEDLRFQAERARKGFDLLEKAALGLPPFDPIEDDPEEAVRQASTHYSEACLTFCDRARKCFEHALAAGDPAVLGDDVRRFLGDVDLSRTLDLLDGANPATAAEEDLVRRIADVEGKGVDLNGLDVVQRLRAFQSGVPMPRGETLHCGTASDEDILVLAFLRMGGESRPWTIAFGHPGEEPTVLEVPEGRNRDLVADMCADFAPVLLNHLRTPGYIAQDPTSWEDLQPFRQIWVPNATHLDMLHHLAYAYAFTKWGVGKRGRLNAFGRACGWLFREANRPGQQHVVLATEALRSSYTFPTQDIRQGHLGFLLAWLEAEGDRDARLEAALDAEELAISTTLDPDLERRLVEPVLEQWAQARADNDATSMESAAETLADFQLDEIRRRYNLTLQAIDVLRRDPRRLNAGVAVLMAEGLKEQWFQHTRLELRQNDPDDGYAFFPSPETDRYPAAAASRYQVQQASEDLVASVLLHDDEEIQLEAIAQGDAFRGTISGVEDRNPGRAMMPVWTVVSDHQGVMRLREGSWVCVIGTPKRTGRILSVSDEPDGTRVFDVEITGWKTVPKSAPLGLLRSDDEQLVGTTAGFVKNSAEQISRRKSRMVWKAEVPGSWLTHARPTGPRTVIDADAAENIEEIEPIRDAG